jgi:CheY-like chemotaxis protein
VVCSPMDISADVASLMRVRADAKKLPLQVKYQGAIPKQIETDPTRLRQILINLVGNAIKFTHQGWVRIVVERLPSVADQTVVAFDVIDTGIGMSEAEIGKLFRPFTQADSSTTRNFGGTGLGLTISKRLAELLGGTVTVASAPGQGSTFRVTIRCGQVSDEVVEHPHEIAAEPASEPARSEAESSGMRARVLLAEDGPDNRRLISFLLTQAGADVETAENGQEAMEKALAGFPGWGRRRSDVRKSFDVILMDMQMPVIDGYEATQRLRAEGYRGPIIALTAHAMNHDRQKCLDAGCDDYLTKPIDKKRLLDIVSRFVAARASATTEEAPGAVEAAID